MSVGGELPPELDRLAEEYVERERLGEHPTISEYVRRHPELADGIREVFPLLAVMEGVKPASASLGPETKALPTIEMLGDHRLLREIGRGGMGVVYEAEQETLGRRVALKVLPPAAMLDRRFVERFRIEAQAAARLQHPHIVPVIGLGEDDGIHYYTMQFIDGRGLDEVLAETRDLLASEGGDGEVALSRTALRLFTADLSDASAASDHLEADAASSHGTSREPSRPGTRAGLRRYRRNVARIGLQGAEALAYAHARGVLHRDVKPSNVLLDEQGRAWITDFGLCREEDSGGLTRTGDLVGTLRYMAPECFQGEHDVRGDVYGLGLVLYELLAAAPAFAEANRAELVRQITQGAPPRLRTRDPAIPADLATIVQKAIAPDPDQRYPTAEALATDLRAYLDGRPIAARAPSVAYLLRRVVHRHRALAVTLVVAVLAFLGVTWFHVRDLERSEATSRLRHYVANIAAVETALRDGDVPQARRLLDDAPAEFRDWEWRYLFSRLDMGIRAYASLSPDTARRVAHSPDGRWLAVAGRQTVHVHALDGGAKERVLPAGETILSLTWSGGGRHIAVGTLTDLVVFAWPGGHEILRRPYPDWIHAVGSDAHRERLFVGADDGILRVLDGETFEEVQQIPLSTGPFDVAVSPDGRFVAVGRQDGGLTLLDAEDLEARWTQEVSSRSVQGVTFVGPDLVTGTSHDGAMRLLRVEDGSLHTVLPHEADLWDVAATRDGALVAALRRGGILQLWDLRDEGRRLEPRSHGREVSSVSFQPDGTRLVTASWSGTIKEWDVSAGHDAHLLRGHLDDVQALAIHPAGRLAASGGAGGILRIWDLDTGEVVRTLFGHHDWVTAAGFSPDGRHLATGGRGPDARVLVWRVSDWTIERRLAAKQGIVLRVAWMPDGRNVLSAGYDGSLCVWDAFRAEPPRRIEISPELFALAVAPDGSRVAVGGADGDIQLLDARSWKLGPRLAGHEDAVRGLAFHPQGHVLASVSADQTVRLWDPLEAESRGVLKEADPDLGRHTDVLEDVVFHPGGTRLVTGSRSASVDVWDWQRGALLSTLKGPLHRVHRVVYGPAGDRLVSAHSLGLVRVWSVRTAAEQEPALRAARLRRDAAAPILEERVRQDGDLSRAIASLRADTALDPVLRESALRLAHARLGSRAGLKRWLWRTLVAADTDLDGLRVARAVADGFVRTHVFRGRQDAEGCLLYGIANQRLAVAGAGYHLERAAALLVDRPELRAIALCFLVLSDVANERRDQAVASLRSLAVHLGKHPEARTARLEGVLDEVRAAYAGRPR